MVEIPESLRSVFTAALDEDDGRVVIDVPSSEIEHGTVTLGTTYRVVVIDAPSETDSSSKDGQPSNQESDELQYSDPPVDPGEIREVTIETLGDQGDGIAKVDRGYVVIVPDTQPGDEPVIEIEEVRPTVAFGHIVKSDPRTL